MHAEDGLRDLLAEPLTPLKPEWRYPAQAELLAQARELDARSPQAYWEWMAQRLRWMQPWTSVCEGAFPAFTYFAGGRLNVADNCIDRWAASPSHAQRPAIVWEAEDGAVRTLTYTELRDRTARLASALALRGVGKGDVVAIFMQNLPEVFVAIHACNRLGAIYTVLFSAFSSEAVALRLQAADPKAVILSDVSYRRGREISLLDTFRAARKQSGKDPFAVVFDRSGTAPVLDANDVDYSTALAQGDPAFACVPLEANEPAFLIFTSGTEAKPKGVVHSSAGFLLGSYANVQWQIGPSDDDVYWCATDVGWLTFPIQAVIGGLAQGMTLLVYEGALDFPDAKRFYTIAARHGVTKVLTAPTALRMLKRVGDDAAAAYPLPKLKLVSVQGEPLDPATFYWTCERLGGGVPVVNAYGQTETGSTWTYPVAGVEALKAGSCGRPVPGHRGAVVDERGERVPPGTKGTLVLYEPFPTLARTIWNDPERYISSYFARFPGRYWTCDEAVEDRDGHLWVLGRADDVINVAGHRISTMEIEAIVAGHPHIAEGAVTGVNDALKGTVPVAFICLRAGAERNAVHDDLMRLVVQKIGPHAKLDAVCVVEALPKTRAGKTMRRLLREIYERGEVRSDVTGLEDHDAIGKVMAGVAAQRSGLS